MKVRIDPELCEGHVRCVQLAPEVFMQDEQGYSSTSDEDVPEELVEKVRQAQRNCPENAISITE